MFDLKDNRGIAGNLTFALIAQALMLVSSVLVALVLPKFLGVSDFGYWQLFALYTSYTGMLLLGVTDGLYLRLGGARVADLNLARVKTQFMTVALSQFVLLFVASVLAWLLLPADSDRRHVVFAVLVYAAIENSCVFLEFFYQAINLTYIYSTSVLVSRVIFLALFGVLLISGVHSYLAYVWILVLCRAAASFYILINARRVLLVPTGSFREALGDLRTDIAAGIKVMVAFYAGLLIVGSGRVLIDWKWGIESFGKFSFAISLVTFVLAFTSQVSLVLFPAIRRLSPEGALRGYVYLRQALFVVLPFLYLMYFPLAGVVVRWLPAYHDSMRYFAVVLPICFFDSKMKLLYNTYLKALRGEAVLLWINLGALATSVALVGMAVFGLQDLELAAVGMVAAIVARSAAAEVWLARRMSTAWKMMFACELLLGVFYVVMALVAEMRLSWVLMAICLCYAINIRPLRGFCSSTRKLWRSRGTKSRRRM